MGKAETGGGGAAYARYQIKIRSLSIFRVPGITQLDVAVPEGAVIKNNGSIFCVVPVPNLGSLWIGMWG